MDARRRSVSSARASSTAKRNLEILLEKQLTGGRLAGACCRGPGLGCSLGRVSLRMRTPARTASG